MAPSWVVPALDEVEDGHPSLRPGLKSAGIEELAFESREKGLRLELSWASPTLPIEGRTPASRHRRPNWIDVCWHPRDDPPFEHWSFAMAYVFSNALVRRARLAITAAMDSVTPILPYSLSRSRASCRALCGSSSTSSTTVSMRKLPTPID